MQGRLRLHFSLTSSSLTPRISILLDGSLEILNASKHDEGVYTCFAENNQGKANSSGYLTITGQFEHALTCAVCDDVRFTSSAPFSSEATSLTEVPEDSEVKVGDEIVLKCSASFDSMLDIVFIWAIDFRVIDFNSEWQHYERIMVSE